MTATTTKPRTDTDPLAGVPAEYWAAFELVVGQVAELAAKPCLAMLANMKFRIETIETLRLAEIAAAAGPEEGAKAANRAQAGTGATKRDRRKNAGRAGVVNNSDKAAEATVDGKLTGDKLDELARADRQSDNAASADDDLVDAVADAEPDQAKGIVDRWLKSRKDQANVDAEYQRQRKNREVRTFESKEGMAVLWAQGDKAAIADLYQQLLNGADAIYQAEGGRDVPRSKHPTTAGQRRFDALQAAVCGHGAATRESGESDSADAAQVDQRDPGRGTSRRHTPRRGRTDPRCQLMITFSAERLFGDKGEAELAELIGCGPISDAAVAHYLDHAEIIPVLVAGDGRPLWLGRSSKSPNIDQIRALILRDQGCGLCGSHYRNCEVHHTKPWSAPCRGQTDVDDLALACVSDHHETHDNKQTWYRDQSAGSWKRRPATPDEIPPHRRSNRNPSRPRSPAGP